jgi:hypothetical protein
MYAGLVTEMSQFLNLVQATDFCQKDHMQSDYHHSTEFCDIIRH